MSTAIAPNQYCLLFVLNQNVMKIFKEWMEEFYVQKILQTGCFIEGVRINEEIKEKSFITIYTFDFLSQKHKDAFNLIKHSLDDYFNDYNEIIHNKDITSFSIADSSLYLFVKPKKIIHHNTLTTNSG